MHLSRAMKRAEAEYENREDPSITSDVACAGCQDEAGDDPVVLLGKVWCQDCGADEAFRLRGDGDEWSALTRHDQVEALEVIIEASRLEIRELLRSRP